MRCLVVLSLALACKTDKPAPAPTPAPPPAPADAARAVGSGSGAPADLAKHVEPPKPIELPKSPDTAPNKTTKPLDKPALDKLAAIELGSFTKVQRGFSDRFLEVRHLTKDRPKLGVMVTIETCAKAKPKCMPIDLDKWKARDDLKQFLSPELAKRPDTAWSVGLTDIGGGAKAFHTFQAGFFVGNDEHGNPIGDYTDAYVLYYNDGINEIRVNAHYLDDSPGSAKALLEMAPEEDLERLAVAFLKYYVHQW